ncbi:unnamed protein product [Dibothriocephalus latus]|uniref:LTD domain-containing protein n=1 Tax=Dibothriocephalus latus TaxID=60516 RepID=A0A3P7LLR0_DIBLA|nr:unnamed protein product [Dibothriocephalus latus]
MSARARKSKQAEHSKTDSPQKSTAADRSHVSVSSEYSRESFTPSRRRERSVSPLNITRSDEKEELASLNDRLAQYIDYVRKLEKDKETMKRKMQSITEERISRVDEARSTYEDEIASLRALVDDLAKQKAATDMELKKHRDDAADAKNKLARRDLEARGLQRKIDALEHDLSAFRDDHECYQRLKPEYDNLEKRLEAMRRDLEAETILRTDLENKVAGLREELDFKNRLFDEERQKLVSRTLTIEEEIEDRKAAEYESRLADELLSFRQQTGDELQVYRTQMENTFQATQKKLDELRAANSNASDESVRLRDEIVVVRKRADDLTHELAKKSGEVDLLNRRLSDLERMLRLQREDFEAQLQEKRAEVKRLQDELEQRFGEFTDLMNTKIALDQEILMYRKMLEGEESRLNIQSPSRDSAFHLSSKKRRLDVDYDDETSSSELPETSSTARYSFRVSTSATGGVEFSSEQDGQGRWVKLVNSSDEEISLGNWVLKHQADGRDCSFKFHRSVTLKPAVTCTIWSSDAGATHNPPKDIVMKNQAFNSGGNISITLTDSDAKVSSGCCNAPNCYRFICTPSFFSAG